jgi:hypothetical protein
MKKYIVLSPDGFTIDFIQSYESKKEALYAFNQFKNRFKAQGFYSSINYGKINLSDLKNFCTFKTINF